MANTTGKKFGGRKKGTPNKTTKEIRNAFQLIIDNNLNNIDKWLNEIAETNPEKAITIILNISEYVLPKLNKVEVEKSTKDDYENMTDEELDAELKKLESQ
jgi:hypothetical protein